MWPCDLEKFKWTWGGRELSAADRKAACASAAPWARPAVVFLWSPHAGPFQNSPSQKTGNICSDCRTQNPTQRTRDVLTTCAAKERPLAAPPSPRLQDPGASGLGVCPLPRRGVEGWTAPGGWRPELLPHRPAACAWTLSSRRVRARLPKGPPESRSPCVWSPAPSLWVACRGGWARGR